MQTSYFMTGQKALRSKKVKTAKSHAKSEASSGVEKPLGAMNADGTDAEATRPAVQPAFVEVKEGFTKQPVNVDRPSHYDDPYAESQKRDSVHASPIYAVVYEATLDAGGTAKAADAAATAAVRAAVEYAAYDWDISSLQKKPESVKITEVRSSSHDPAVPTGPVTFGSGKVFGKAIDTTGESKKGIKPPTPFGGAAIPNPFKSREIDASAKEAAPHSPAAEEAHATTPIETAAAPQQQPAETPIQPPQHSGSNETAPMSKLFQQAHNLKFDFGLGKKGGKSSTQSSTAATAEKKTPFSSKNSNPFTADSTSGEAAKKQSNATDPAAGLKMDDVTNIFSKLGVSKPATPALVTDNKADLSSFISAARAAGAHADDRVRNPAMLWTEVETLLRTEQYAECNAKLSAYISQRPKEALPYLRRAQTHEKMENFEEAFLDCERALALETHNDAVHRKLAELYCNAGFLPKALEHLGRVVEPDKSLRAWTQLISEYMVQESKIESMLMAKDNTGAIEAIRKLRESSPSCKASLKSQVLLATANLNLHRYESGATECAAILPPTLGGSNCSLGDVSRFAEPLSELCLSLARIYWYSEQVVRAIKVLDDYLRSGLTKDVDAARLLKATIDAVDKYKCTGNEYFKSKRFLEAVSAYNDALRMVGNNTRMKANLYSNRAAALMECKSWHDALADCRQAMELSVGHCKAMLRGAKCCMQLERYEAAIDLLKKVQEAIKAGQPGCGIGGRTEVALKDVVQQIDYCQKKLVEKRDRESRAHRADRSHFTRDDDEGEWSDDFEYYGSESDDMEFMFKHNFTPRPTRGGAAGSHRFHKDTSHYGASNRTNSGAKPKCSAPKFSPPKPAPKARVIDHYKILQVEPDADDEAVKKAYKTLARLHHPDKGGDAEVFKQVNEAFTVLMDPVRRLQHDGELAHARRRR